MNIEKRLEVEISNLHDLRNEMAESVHDEKIKYLHTALIHVMLAYDEIKGEKIK